MSFYNTYLLKCRYQDVYHKALVYFLGLSEDTKNHIHQIYDFKTGYVKLECLQDGWQTSGSQRIIRIAFNLYRNGTPEMEEVVYTIPRFRIVTVFDVSQTEGEPLPGLEVPELTGIMKRGETPAEIRKCLSECPPRSFSGHSVSVSDVLILNQEGEVVSYYAENEGFIVLADFIRQTLISYDTTDFHIEGKAGSRLAYDSIVIDGREFFLMEYTVYGSQAANVVLDADGKLVVDNVSHGFDDTVQRQIQEYLHPGQEKAVQETQRKPTLEMWQKAYENREYLRSAEITEEQNYNMIDGRMNNLPPKSRKIGKRISVLDRLHLKQAEIAKRDKGALRWKRKKRGSRGGNKKEEATLPFYGRYLPFLVSIYQSAF